MSHNVEGPLVGIAIPAYNSAETLGETLRSCIAQSWTRWFAVVTVDGNDATREQAIVDSLEDPRIVLECNGKQAGQFGNFNRALLRCYGTGATWIKFLCADDILYPDALQRMVEVGESREDCGLVYGYYDGIDEDGELLTRVDLTQVHSRAMNGRSFLVRAFSESLFNIIGGPSSVMIRSDTIERCGIFDDRLNYSGEALLWYRILSRFAIGIVGERPVLKYRFHQNSITGRGGLTAARFEQPLDIARDIASQYPPRSPEWHAANWIMGEMLASNLITAASLLRRGEGQVAWAGARASARRLTRRSGTSLTYHCLVKALRLIRRGPQHLPSDLCPAVIRCR